MIEHAGGNFAAVAARFRVAAAERDLSAVAAETYLSLVRPALKLTKDGPGPIVAVIGGNPPVPEGIALSERLFVAAVDCSTLPPGVTGLPLPAEGHLFFFADPWPFSMVLPDAVQYIPPGTPLGPEEPVDPDHEEINARSCLHGRHRAWSWPHNAAHLWSQPPLADLPAEELREAWGSAEELPGVFGDFQLGGYPLIFQNDPFEPAQGTSCCEEEMPLPPAEDGDEWVLLATWNAREDSPHMPDGLFHWIVLRSDLAALRFDRVYTFAELA
ncbi:DUF1963 domain-containing protein [Streptomyces sp. NPDC014779]|uniref:DUF1963 domain-containing protein n=1 Tax=Streptomyces sp. NPDC014779 TaxID=3364911 RepID=UPI0036FD78B0